jgi:hypothetical protein
MKNLLRAFLLIAFVFLLNSFISAETVYPSFNIYVQDGSPTGHSYTGIYYIANANNTNGSPFGPWGLPDAIVINSITLETSMAGRTIYPADNWPDVKCYRIIVKVTRDDGEQREGYSSLTDNVGLQNGSLQINVPTF